MISHVSGALRPLLLPTTALLLLLAPQPLRSEKAPADCLDLAWREYNSCLMESRSSLLKVVCDYNFVMDSAECDRRAGC